MNNERSKTLIRIADDGTIIRERATERQSEETSPLEERNLDYGIQNRTTGNNALKNSIIWGVLNLLFAFWLIGVFGVANAYSAYKAAKNNNTIEYYKRIKKAKDFFFIGLGVVILINVILWIASLFPNALMAS